MKIANTQYGIMTFGAAIGQRLLYITITDDTADTPLYDQLIAAVEDKKDAYTACIDGSRSTFLAFKGGAIEKAENNPEWDLFAQRLSHESLAIQKSTNPGALRPPYMMYVGVPSTFTGIRDFYQNFNTVIALIDGPSYSATALQEMVNHQFSQVVLKKQADGTVPEIKVGIRKAVVLDDAAGGLEEYCITNNIRYYRDYDSPQKLDVWTL
jgi:hypothetical protein